MKTRQQGFTLIESMIVVAIIGVVTGIALYQSFGTMESYEANSAMDTVIGQLRIARQLAIAQRRPVQITITPVSTDNGLPTITYTAVTNGTGLAAFNDGGYAPTNTMPLPHQTQLLIESGVPDTPMAFGTCAAVCIGGTNGGPGTMYFTPTGQFSQDTAGVLPLNGTIFMGVPNRADTARAVTIMGATGRVRPYTFIVTSTTPFTGHWTE